MASKSPLVSVILSVHNCAPYLQETLESLYAQTLEDFELIVVNDGSADDTRRILERQSDKRVRVIHNDKNVGVSASRNAGMERAKSDTIAVADGDDVYFPDRLLMQYSHMSKHAEVDVLSGPGFYMSEEGKLLGRIGAPQTHAEIRFALHWCNPIINSCAMYRRTSVESVGGYDTTFRRFQDWELWSRLIDTAKFANLAEPLVKQRLHPGSNMATSAREAFELAVGVVRRLLRRYLRQPIEADEARGFALLLFPFYSIPSSGVGPGLNLVRRFVERAMKTERDLNVRRYRPTFAESILTQSRNLSYVDSRASFRLLAESIRMHPLGTFSRKVGAQWARLLLRLPQKRLAGAFPKS